MQNLTISADDLSNLMAQLAPGVIAGIANNATAQTAMIPTDSR